MGDRHTLKLGRRFRASLDAAGVVAGTDTGRRIGAVLRALAADEALPRPGDAEMSIPPVRTAYVRRVVGENLWVLYEVRGPFVIVLHVARSPPVPLEP